MFYGDKSSPRRKFELQFVSSLRSWNLTNATDDFVVPTSDIEGSWQWLNNEAPSLRLTGGFLGIDALQTDLLQDGYNSGSADPSGWAIHQPSSSDEGPYLDLVFSDGQQVNNQQGLTFTSSEYDNIRPIALPSTGDELVKNPLLLTHGRDATTVGASVLNPVVSASPSNPLPLLCTSQQAPINTRISTALWSSLPTQSLFGNTEHNRSSPSPTGTGHASRRERRYLCSAPNCSKRFIDAYNLERHERSVHQKQSLYFCSEPTCPRAASSGRGFARKDKLMEHLRTSGHHAAEHSIAESSRAAGKRRRLDDVPGEATSPVAVQAQLSSVPIQGQLEQGAAIRPAAEESCCEKLRKEVERLKEAREEDRRMRKIEGRMIRKGEG